MIRLTRNEIYELVWRLPMTQIAKKYSISDVGFRKQCKRLNIPYPKLGEWTKMKTGHSVGKPKLPDQWKGNDFVMLKERPDGEPVRQVSELNRLVRQIMQEQLPFKVPDRLTRPHHLIITAKESLARLTDLNHPNVATTAEGQLDIKVTKGNIGRALRFMDTLIKCIKARGYRYEAAKDGNYVVIRQNRLKVNFRELTTKVKVQHKGYQDYEFKPTGQLVFRLNDRLKAHWQDLKSQLLEDQLPKILAKLELVAIQEEQYQEKARLWQENWEKQRKLEAERTARQRQELKDFKELVQRAKQWKRAQLLREYLASVPGVNAEWHAWAQHKADWYDPLTSVTDEWLEGVNKDEL